MEICGPALDVVCVSEAFNDGKVAGKQVDDVVKLVQISLLLLHLPPKTNNLTCLALKQKTDVTRFINKYLP